MKLVIDRNTWLRGGFERNQGYSCLRDEQGRKCCLGFYLEACGFSQTQITGSGSPHDVFSFLGPRTAARRNWKPRWLLRKDNKGVVFDDSSDCSTLMNVNDNVHIEDPTSLEILSEADREKQIKKIFAKHGVTVTFVGPKADASKLRAPLLRRNPNEL